MGARRSSSILAVGAVVVASIALSIAAAASAEDPAAAWSKDAIRARFPDPDAKAKAEDYSGSIECKDCHQDRWDSLGTSFHATLRNEKKSATRGCETCHGPGMVHVDGAGDDPIRHPTKADVKTSLGACLVCHVEVLEKPVLGHRTWILEKDGSPRSCLTCHRVHVDKAEPAFDEKLGPFADAAALAAAGATPVPATVCATCHTSFHPQMSRSGHAKLAREGDQCAACHGNGSLHAASAGDARKILRPDRQKPADSDASCLACHRSGDSVARWTCSEHSREKVACVVCHDPNAPRGKTLRGTEFELCGGCHKDVQAKLRLPNGHRVERGRVQCSDCHDPHGNTSQLRDKDLRTRVCADCHVEKAGPFLFDHGIKRSDGCVACHDPHGSVNRRMLTYSRMKPMCLQCHPESSHDLSKRKYDNCISCHVEIHGSDFDRYFIR